MAAHVWAESGRSPCGWTLPGPSRWRRPPGPRTSCWAPVPSAPPSLDRDGGDRLACGPAWDVAPSTGKQAYCKCTWSHIICLSLHFYCRIFSDLTIFMCDVDVRHVFLFTVKCLNGASNIKKSHIHLQQWTNRSAPNNFEIVFIYSFYLKAARLKYQIHRAKTVIKDYRYKLLYIIWRKDL